MMKHLCIFLIIPIISSCNLLGIPESSKTQFNAPDISARNDMDNEDVVVSKDVRDVGSDISRDVVYDISSDITLGCDTDCDQGTSPVDSPLLAFPDVKGFGADTVGGRGGRVIYVTNLDDSGPGSFREAVESSGSRTVIFRIGGTIVLESAIRIENPFLTIAGHTAPGQGITIRGNGAKDLNLIQVNAREIIFRHIRLRRGASTEVGDCDGNNLVMSSPQSVVIDHISTSWAPETLMAVWAATSLSVQNSIFSESLFESSLTDDCTPTGNPEAKGFGVSISGPSTKVSFVGNLFAHHVGMTPFLSSSIGGDFEVVNNVVYDVCYAMGFRERDGPQTFGNFLGNYIKNGVNSCELHRNNINVAGNVQVYMRDNLTPLRNATQDEWWASSEQQVATPADTALQSDIEFDFPIKDAISAIRTHDELPGQAGANLVTDETGKFVKYIDDVDERIIRETSSGSRTDGNQGYRIDHPDQVGGWQFIASGTPYPDTDEDGMPDAWEEEHGLDKMLADDTEDPDSDGYTNLEEYLNQTRPK